MAKTLRELMEFLKNYDADILIELLKIDSEEIVERFVDKIENDFEELENEMEEEQEEE